MEEHKRKLFLESIKKKKEFAGLADSIAKREMNLFFKRNPKVQKQLEEKGIRSTLFKQAVKEVRKGLHKSHGVFQKGKKVLREKFLQELKESEDLEVYKKILKTNISTRERLSHYESLYKDIFLITSNPKSILDLSSGLNPLSFPWMNLKKIQYTATEINKEDVDFLNDYFNLMKSKGLNGKASILDLSEEDSLDKLKKLSDTDVCFMFKLIESIEFSKKRKYRLVEALLTSIKSKWIITSFATKTISQKEMKFKQRTWFELMLKRLNLKFTKLDTSNEIYYIIKNK
ncbi:hypothetical protein ACFLZZ_01715 [Nanoarchaeota archaeon]